jgi:predicted ester cyclase
VGRLRVAAGRWGIDRDGLKAVLAYYFAAFPHLRYDVEEVVAEGDSFVVQGTMSGTQHGEYDGQPPSGRHVEVDEVDVFLVRDGFIRGYRIVWDELGFRRQLGLPLA